MTLFQSHQIIQAVAVNVSDGYGATAVCNTLQLIIGVDETELCRRRHGNSNKQNEQCNNWFVMLLHCIMIMVVKESDSSC